jgi:ABC-2 type transport system ATP-binding protein
MSSRGLIARAHRPIAPVFGSTRQFGPWPDVVAGHGNQADPMIDVREVTKRYGRTVALDGLSFMVRPGYVTGFLGPNGAGKSTTMRVVLGLDAPASGHALICGRPYTRMRRPMHEVGALLDATAVHGSRSAINHLRCLARTNRIADRRVVAVLDEVGLAGVARRRTGGFSLGMRQRLAIAAALLGDPGVLLFDEPFNGLDPDGLRWIRGLLRSLAHQGRTVLVSSHLMGELQLVADRLIIIGRGRLIADTSVRELAERFDLGVLVRSPSTAQLARALEGAGATVAAQPDGALSVSGLDATRIGDLATQWNIPLHEVTPRSASLEEAYLQLTAGSVEHHAGTGAR